jgi:hypothetical protein
MASFRPQQQTPYTSSGNEQTVQTGETLGKALQSVRNKIQKKARENCEYLFSRFIQAIILILQHHQRVLDHHQ